MSSSALRSASKLRSLIRPNTVLPARKRGLYFYGPKASDRNPSKPISEYSIKSAHTYSERSSTSSSNAAYDSNAAAVNKDIAHIESIGKRGNINVTEKTSMNDKLVQE